jgi:hypothetical protein
MKRNSGGVVEKSLSNVSAEHNTRILDQSSVPKLPA